MRVGQSFPLPANGFPRRSRGQSLRPCRHLTLVVHLETHVRLPALTGHTRVGSSRFQSAQHHERCNRDPSRPAQVPNARGCASYVKIFPIGRKCVVRHGRRDGVVDSG